MRLLTTESGQDFAAALGKHIRLIPEKIETKQFRDKEIFAQINDTSKDVVLVTRLQNFGHRTVNDQIMELVLISDLLKEEGASLTAVIPYLPYSRQDKVFLKGECLSARALSSLLQSSGINRIITADVHSPKVAQFYQDFENIQAIDVFVNYMQKLGNVTVVAPDNGAVVNSKKIAGLINSPLAIMEKHRPRPGVAEILDIDGNCRAKNLVIIDDMIDSGGTMAAVIEKLKCEQPRSVSIFATHPILSSPATERMSKLGIKVIATNTVSHPKEYLNMNPWLEQLDISHMFAEVLK